MLWCLDEKDVRGRGRTELGGRATAPTEAGLAPRLAASALLRGDECCYNSNVRLRRVLYVMRSIVLLVLVIAMCGVVAPLATAHDSATRAASHRGPSRCSTVHSHLVAADTQAQVFTALNSYPTNSYYGCVYGSRHIYELGTLSDCEDVSLGGCGGISRLGLAGTIVAYEEFMFPPGGAWWVVVRDLRSGRVLRRLPTNAPGPVNTAGAVEALVVKSDGAVAWIAQAHLPTAIRNGPREYELYAADARSESRLLASGPGIGPRSLALVGSTVYWMQEGHPMSAFLH